MVRGSIPRDTCLRHLKVGGSIPPSLNACFGGVAQSGERQTEVENDERP